MKVSYVKVDSGVGTGAGQGEAALDIEQLIGLAPKANLIVYQGPNNNSDSPGTGPYDTLAAMVSQDKAQVMSNSWGECETLEGLTDAHAESTLLEEAATQGQTFVSAAGDSGSEDCYSPPPGGNAGQRAGGRRSRQPAVRDKRRWHIDDCDRAAAARDGVERRQPRDRLRPFRDPAGRGRWRTLVAVDDAELSVERPAGRWE